MKILITGADGFIGSHLTQTLFDQGHDIRALSQYNSFNLWGWLDYIDCKNDIEILSGDIRDSFFCQQICKDIDIVYNLAALIAIPYSYVSPQSYIDTNINGSFNLAMACRDQKVKRLIHTSTSEVYGTAQYVPIDEKHPLQPQSPYSASKISADAMVMSFKHTYDLPVIIARPFNTYGPRQSARAIIPSIISQLSSEKNAVSLGDLSPTRDLNYVLDTCEALRLLSECDEAIGQTVNIGSNTEISMEDLFNLINKLMNKNATVLIDKNRIRPKNSEVQRLKCDNTLLKKLTNFKPNYTLEEGLKKTIKWFSDKENLKKYKTEMYNL
jgi:NAD dependent epimerase/dehydratase